MKYDVIVSSIKNSNLTFQQAGQGICPAEGTDPATDTGTATVDPSYTGCDVLSINRIKPLQTCKNNCKGGENIQLRSDVQRSIFSTIRCGGWRSSSGGSWSSGSHQLCCSGRSGGGRGCSGCCRRGHHGGTVTVSG